MKISLISALVFVVFLFPASAPTISAGEEPPRPTVRELIDEGVRLHDAGKLDEAIDRYKRALEAEPNNSEALYELANSYMVSQRFDLCGEAARRGLKKPGEMEGPLFGMVGSCLSSAGKPEEAIRAFKEGLAKYPNDLTLNFNIAVTLSRQGKLQQAIPHLEKTIQAKPSYSSPYFALGEIYAAQGQPTPGIFYFMRFVSLEPNTPRSAHAAAKVFELLTSGVKTEGEKNVTISLPADFGKATGAFAPLETGRTIAAATIHLEKAQAESKAQRYVSALTSFVQIADELALGKDGADLARTFLWEKATLPMFELKKRGALECFGHVLALRAGFDGAEKWLDSHAQQKQALETTLAELRP